MSPRISSGVTLPDRPPGNCSASPLEAIFSTVYLPPTGLEYTSMTLPCRFTIQYSGMPALAYKARLLAQSVGKEVSSTSITRNASSADGRFRAIVVVAPPEQHHVGLRPRAFGQQEGLLRPHIRGPSQHLAEHKFQLGYDCGVRVVDWGHPNNLTVD